MSSEQIRLMIHERIKAADEARIRSMDELDNEEENRQLIISHTLKSLLIDIYDL